MMWTIRLYAWYVSHIDNISAKDRNLSKVISSSTKFVSLAPNYWNGNSRHIFQKNPDVADTFVRSFFVPIFSHNTWSSHDDKNLQSKKAMPPAWSTLDNFGTYLNRYRWNRWHRTFFEVTKNKPASQAHI